ncbi:glyceraldehyde-3-phosphate dehydrogenase, testis-specific-like [Cucurbita maxima]|uniref:Glyceraldehyde-3-phosphate dehydrogenase, testis-specific-like n=1 Tax=Cucurbita maxima TaxID=3661 RepID=A0A6J1KR41_CUCMA|nr:glyceraldehyde-3-phosphate dehydrogenase, testis-specific-like [Cucurbita maxima]
MANLVSIYFTFLLFTLSKFSFLSSATAVAKDQVGCSMCSSCDNPCQLPPPPPPPPTSQCPPPPPPPPPSCSTCVHPSPTPPTSVQPYQPADGGQFPGLAPPPPPNPILPYYPYYYYSPPTASGESVSISWKILPLGLLIIICL